MGDTVRVRVQRGGIEVEAEGGPDFVSEQIEKWLGGQTAAASTPGALDGGNGSDGVRSAGGPVRLKDFMTAKAPKNQAEFLTTLTAWAKDYEGLQAVGQADIERLHKLAGVKRPSDVMNAMAQVASKRGWLENAGSGTYRLTPAGEDTVTYDLPRKA